MKILTNAQIERIQRENYDKGKIDGIELITNFFKRLGKINIHNAPIIINTDKPQTIKDNIFALNHFGVYIKDKKEKPAIFVNKKKKIN